jgi:hypothetical protein
MKSRCEIRGITDAKIFELFCFFDGQLHTCVPGVPVQEQVFPRVSWQK